MRSLALSLLIALILITVPTTIAQKKGPDKTASPSTEERGILRNEYGDEILDASGHRINYSREHLQLKAGASIAQSIASAPTPPPDAEPAWSYAAFGSGLGQSNLIIAQNGSHTEVYLGGSGAFFGSNGYWFVLRYNASTNDYEQIYSSSYYSSGIRRIQVANIIGDSRNEIIVALQDGKIFLYDQASKKLLQTLTTSASELWGLEIVDIEGDGANDLVISTYDRILVYSASGALKWSLTDVGGEDIAVAQMDKDSALEIAVTGGQVIDTATRSIQWTLPNSFGRKLEAADVDGDNIKELIVAEFWQFVRAYDVDQQLLKWSIMTSHDIGAIRAVDIDGDSIQELLVGDGQWGSISAYDTMTQNLEWWVPNPEHGVTDIATGDVDGDGATELLWGAGASSTGPDHLYVVNWQTRQIEWQNIHLDGPFIGPEIGDLDGDGRSELVTVTTSSNSGYGSGRILVFDAATRRLRAMSDQVMRGSAWTGVHEFKLRDVDGDGRLEILIAAGEIYDGVIEIYDFNANNSFALIWANATRPNGATFNTVEATDIDNDGDIEIIAGVRIEHTGFEGISLFVYDYSTRNEEWSKSLAFGPIQNITVADLDQDGSKEIVLIGGNNRSVNIIDGISRSLEATLTGPFTDLRIHNMNGAPTIAVGNLNGDLIMYRYAFASFTETYRQRLVSSPIAGFTFDDQNRVWVGSYGKLTLFTLSGTPLWTYDSGFGPVFDSSVFGRRIAFLPGSSFFFTAGDYSVVGFSGNTGEDNFDICLQDDGGGSLFRFNSTTGDYQFSRCDINFTLSGRATLTRGNSLITLQHNASDRRVLVRVDTRAKSGTSSVQVFSPRRTFTIIDRDITNNSCGCS